MKVYLAGKIGKHDWRHTIFKGLRNAEFAVEKDKIQMVITNNNFTYNGPYFIACDHGCYHNKNSHGRGLTNSGCEENGDSHKNTLEKCLKWIESSDLLFAWLDSTDAYGTISEIGYAKALKKPIYLAIDKKIGKSAIQDLWFVQEMATTVEHFGTVEEAWESFSSLYGKDYDDPFTYIDEPFSYISDKANLIWIKTKITEFCNVLAFKHSVEELNNFDRMTLVKEFFKQKERFMKKYFDTSTIRSAAFTNDIAVEIDFRIVRGYFKNKTKFEAYDLKAWSTEGTNLIYKFKYNYEREKEFTKSSSGVRAIAKQKKFINQENDKELAKKNSAAKEVTTKENDFIKHESEKEFTKHNSVTKVTTKQKDFINYLNEKELTKNNTAKKVTSFQLGYINVLLTKIGFQLSHSAATLDWERACEFIRLLVDDKPIPKDLEKYVLKK